VNETQRIIVVGAGAIGASIGALLFEAGTHCILIARNDSERVIRERGVDLRFPRSARQICIPTASNLRDVNPTSEDLVLLATMGHSTEEALDDLSPTIPVASFQNGFAPLEWLAQRGHPTLAAMVYVPAERRAPGVVALPGAPNAGSILIGDWPTGSGALARWLVGQLRKAQFHAEVEPDIAPWIRAKLLVSLGGIVAAICDLEADVIEAARAEARSVWKATSEPFEDIPALLRRIGPLETALVDGRSRIGGSTRASLARGEKLETRILHESIVRGGRSAGVATPVNEGLIHLAERAVREQWKVGAMNPSELRRHLAL
jgi:2-dehydropantoate 2-reductase